MSAVEAKAELVQVGSDVVGLDARLVRAELPALDERDDRMDSGKSLVCQLIRTLHVNRFVRICGANGSGIGPEPVGDEGRTRFHVLQQEAGEFWHPGILDDAYPCTSEIRCPNVLDCYCYQDFPGGSSVTLTWLGCAQERLVHFHVTMQSFTTWTYQDRAVAMQHRPGGLVRAKPEHQLQPLPLTLPRVRPSIGISRLLTGLAKIRAGI